MLTKGRAAVIIQTFDGLGPGLKDDPETESVGKRSWGFMPPVQFRDGKRSGDQGMV